ncbi:MAG: hypothetical protein ABGW84_11360 [Sphingomonadaceae bacterium]
MNAPTHITPNLPALLSGLPEDDPRKPCVEFTRAVQVVFLEALAVVGSVRAAARKARVSHQTVYRARRACADFRRCWEAAQLQALARAEDVLACRAIDGVEETVFYHGEEVAKRRRYDGRLLLAHIGRLDRLSERAEVRALSDEFDAAMAAFGQGKELPGEALPAHHAAEDRASVSRHARDERGEGGEGEPAAASGGEGADCGTSPAGAEPSGKKGPGQCNTRSIALDAMRRQDWASPAFWAPVQWRDPDYDKGWRARVAEMLEAREALAEERGAGDPVVFELLAEPAPEPDDADGAPQDATLETLQACIEQQVLAFERGTPEWWLVDAWGHIRQDVQAEWARDVAGCAAEEAEAGGCNIAVT